MNSEDIYKRLQEVAKHYLTAKKHLLYSENTSNSINLGVINELRNSYDHLIKGIIKKDNQEFDKSISHLRRAAYDACETISLNSFEDLSSKISNFDIDTISAVLPDYFTVYYPRLKEIQQELVKERSKNDELFSNEKHLENYTALYQEIQDINTVITKAIVGMSEYNRIQKKGNKKKTRKDIVINIIVGVISAILTALILSLF